VRREKLDHFLYRATGRPSLTAKCLSQFQKDSARGRRRKKKTIEELHNFIKDNAS
jgi:hypothetical protein